MRSVCFPEKLSQKNCNKTKMITVSIPRGNFVQKFLITKKKHYRSNVKSNNTNDKPGFAKQGVLLSVYRGIKHSDLCALKIYAYLISSLRDHLRRSSKFIADFSYF